MRHVALEIPLGAFAIVRCGQRGDPANPRIEPLRDALDRATLAGGIASFEDHHEPVAAGDNPVLQLHEFALQAEQFAKVDLALLTCFGGKRAVAVEDAIVDFHLEFFVIAVDQVFFEAALFFLRIHGKLRLVGHVDRVESSRQAIQKPAILQIIDYRAR